MPISSAILKAKALATVTAIDKMRSTSHSISKTLGDDFNLLLRHVADAYPELIPLLPPKTEFAPYVDGELHGKITFEELGIYCQQLAAMLQ